MTSHQLSDLLGRLLAEGHEKGWIEFKHNKDNPQEIGEYLRLSNWRFWKSRNSLSDLGCARRHTEYCRHDFPTP